MRLHPASLAVGAALAIGVALLSAQQIVGSPAVEVKVIEMPPITMADPSPRAIPVPPLNGSSTIILAPGETVDFSTVRVQWNGDPNLTYDMAINLVVQINGVNLTGYQFEGPHGAKALPFPNASPYLARSGDQVSIVRTPAHSGHPDAPPAFAATVFIDVEKN